MFNLRLCKAAIIRYSQLKFGHMYPWGMDYKYFSPHCCKCNSFGCTAAIRWGNACHGPHSDSLYSGSEHSQFNSPRLIKREAGFPNPGRALIGSNQRWRVNDSPYYRELAGHKPRISPDRLTGYTGTHFIDKHCTPLIHWGQDKMAAISQTTFSSAFSKVKLFDLRLKFHWSLFPRIQLTLSPH